LSGSIFVPCLFSAQQPLELYPCQVHPPLKRVCQQQFSVDHDYVMREDNKKSVPTGALLLFDLFHFCQI
jgi:hypothetical protein